MHSNRPFCSGGDFFWMVGGRGSPQRCQGAKPLVRGSEGIAPLSPKNFTKWAISGGTFTSASPNQNVGGTCPRYNRRPCRSAFHTPQPLNWNYEFEAHFLKSKVSWRVLYDKCAKTDEPIEMVFEVQTLVDLQNVGYTLYMEFYMVGGVA